MSNTVAVSLVSGSFLLASAVIGFFATRSEPRRAKEILALNAIIQGLGEGESRQSLERKRDRIIKTYEASDTPPDRSLQLVMVAGAGSLLVLASAAFDGSALSWHIARVAAELTFLVLGFLLIGAAVAASIGIWIVDLKARRRLRKAAKASATSNLRE